MSHHLGISERGMGNPRKPFFFPLIETVGSAQVGDIYALGCHRYDVVVCSPSPRSLRGFSHSFL